MTLKKQIVIHTLIGCFLIGILIAASFIDQKFAEYVYIGDGISVVGTVLGKLPAWIFFVVGASILMRGSIAKVKSDRSRIPLSIFYTILLVGGAMLLGYSIVEDVISGLYKYIVAVLIGGCVSLLIIMLSTKFTPEIIVRLKKWSILTIITVGIILLLTTIIKFSWGRARYLEIITGDNVFTTWYSPQGFTGGTSMPSGHTALAGAMFLLPFMFLSLPKMAAYAPSATALALLYVIFIAVTRLLGGYHFLSDVTVAAIISYVTTFICGNILFGKNLSKTNIEESSFLNKL